MKELQERSMIESLIPNPKRHPYSEKELDVTMETAQMKPGYTSIHRGKGRQAVRFGLKVRVRAVNSYNHGL